MNTNPFLSPTEHESMIESQQRRIKHTADRYKIMRRQTIAANLILAFLLGIIIIDPLYNRQWIARTPV
jgi:hypothetical protein